MTSRVVKGISTAERPMVDRLNRLNKPRADARYRPDSEPMTQVEWESYSLKALLAHCVEVSSLDECKSLLDDMVATEHERNGE